MLSVSDHNQAPKSLSSVLMCNLVHFKSGKAQGTIQGLRVVTVKWGLEKKKKKKRKFDCLQSFNSTIDPQPEEKSVCCSIQSGIDWENGTDSD